MEYLYWVSCIVGFFYVWDRLWWRYQRNLKQKLSENKQLSAQQVWDYTVGETKYSQLVRFPDGGVEITNPAKAIKADIPDYTTWSEPMVELFLLIVKDWRNWTSTGNHDVCGNYKEVFSHENTGVSIKKLLWVVNMENIDNSYYRENCHIYTNDLLNDCEISSVIRLAKIWKAIHYGDKLARIKHIKTLRSNRIRQEEEIKQEELAKIARSEEAQKIRDYLEGIDK